MRRRDFLARTGAAAAGVGLAGLAGCTGLFETRSALQQPLVEDRPDAVYLPTHYEGMQMVGMQKQGPYACALTYTYPHRFWLVAGQTEKVAIDPDDSLHLMPVVWHRETATVIPDSNPQIEITQDGESVVSVSPWPMLSQPMGFHFGDNVQLPGEGSYEVAVNVSGFSTRRTGDLADGEGERTTFTFDLEYARSKLEEIAINDLSEDEQGSKGAVEPSEMEMLPSTQVPRPADLPGRLRGTATSGDATFAVTTLDDATRVGGDDSQAYLAVSPRTPHNRYVLPGMSLSGTLRRDGSAVSEGYLTATLDPDLGFHYGRVVDDVAADDELTVTVDAPPQIARHEGYETAFVDMPDVTITL